MPATPVWTQIADDLTRTVREISGVHQALYGQAIDLQQPLGSLPIGYVYGAQHEWTFGDMNALALGSTTYGIGLLYPLSRGASLWRVGEQWMGQIIEAVMSDPCRNNLAFLTEPTAAAVEPVVERTDVGLVWMQFRIDYYVAWTNAHSLAAA
jgi:hypothetical protein